MKALITGAGGLVGSHLVEYYRAHGVEPIPTDLAGFEVAGNLLDRDFVSKRLGALDFDVVVHLAAITDIKKTIEDPRLCFEVNCLGTLNMLELAVSKGVKRFIYSSSANVFGAPKSLPVTESSPFDPRVPYDYSKVVGENMAMSYYKTKALPVTITRSWLMFGEYDQPTRAILRFIRACLADEPITLFNQGRDTTAPTHAANYAKLTLAIMGSDAAVGTAFNFGGEKTATIAELAEKVRQLTGSKSRLVLAPPRSELEREPQVSYPALDKLRNVLRYGHELSLEQGLLRTIDWVRGGSKPPSGSKN